MLLVYTAKNLTSFGSYELNIKTQITLVFGKMLKFKDSFPLNNFFSGSITNIKLEYEKYGLKWDHFLTAHLTLIYSLTSHAYYGIFLFLLMVVWKKFLHRSQWLLSTITLSKITKHNRKTTKFMVFSERCPVYIWSLCSPNVNLKDRFRLTFFCC